MTSSSKNGEYLILGRNSDFREKFGILELEMSHPGPEHDIINEIGQDLHIELVDDNLLSKASSNSFEEVGNENNVYKDF